MEFWKSAEDLHDLDGDPNSIVSLYVLAGIAASDAVCAAKLGEYARGENHAEALGVLKRADSSLVPALQRLLSRKTDAGYGSGTISAALLTAARSAAQKLVDAARAI